MERIAAMTADVDEAYRDVSLARLYDAECPWHEQDDFYLALDLRAGAVLDVGCGTGTRLARAREVGHRGRLVGVDPGEGMLAVARGKTDRVEWLHGDAQTLAVDGRFDLVTMTGHAFQTLLDDVATRAALAAFHSHLVGGGLLAFETRNPAARPWLTWTAAASRGRIEGPDGEPYDVWVDSPQEVPPDLVTFDAHTHDVGAGTTRSCHSTLRFVDPDHLRGLLGQAGFTIEGWFGDWDRSPVTESSPEIVVLARR